VEAVANPVDVHVCIYSTVWSKSCVFGSFDDLLKTVKAVVRKSRYYDTEARTGFGCM
jgi:hypothetical protein